MPASPPRSNTGGAAIRKRKALEREFASSGGQYRPPGGQWQSLPRQGGNPGVQRSSQTRVLGSSVRTPGRGGGKDAGTIVHRSGRGNPGGPAGGGAAGAQTPLGRVRQFNAAHGGAQRSSATVELPDTKRERVRNFIAQSRAQRIAQARAGVAQQRASKEEQRRKTKFYQREVYRVSDWWGKVSEQVGNIRTVGGSGLLVLILLFFIVVVIKVSKSGTLTRAQLMFFTILGQASLPPQSEGGPGASSQTVAQITTPQPVTPNVSGIGLSPAEKQSNVALSAANVTPVGASPRPSRLPPVMPQ